jgi:hypothetical protein
VIVLEAGGYFNESDFNQSELWAYQNIYWRGGPTPTLDMNVTLLAGSCLGGGTVVNWTNSLATKPWVRQEWADEHGLTDLADDFDRHVEAVWQRRVLAAGSLESPGVLLRTGIGGPAVGQNLRLHPCTATVGVYGEDVQAWWGTPQAGLIDEYSTANDGYGFLLEGTQYTTALSAAATPWVTAEQHKTVMNDFSRCTTFIGLARDQGSGQVTLDENGQTVPTYAVTNEADIVNMRDALGAQIRCHAAGGAERIHVLSSAFPTWHRGDDLEAFITQVQTIPLRAGSIVIFSAHQMGTCRMGSDPEQSVASPTGELHDVKGVWIGDASAFPTSSGTNPMITIMSLAHRTAENIALAAGTKMSPALQKA